MALWSPTVRAGYYKILATFTGVNHFLHQVSHGTINAKCPCCSHRDETTEHIILCQNSARTALYHSAVKKLGQWMNNQQTDPLISTMVLKYLRAQKSLTMYQCYEGSRSLTSLGWALAKAHDRLGWRNFSEGRIASKYESIQCRWYQQIKSHQSSQKWTANFIAQLIKITHLQWTYCNNFLHYRQHSGAETASEYDNRMSRIIDTFEWVDPNKLLPQDRHLVDSHSTETLAMVVTSDAMIAWEESMRTAFAAAHHSRVKRTLESISCVDYNMLQASPFCPNPPNKRAPTVKRRKR